MTSEKLTSLELAILQVFFEEYGAHGFPPPDEIKVISRNNTGAGRYVYLKSNKKVFLKDSYLDMGGKFIEMEGVFNGLMAVVSIANSEIDQLEIATYENDWNGVESGWKII